MPSYYLDTNALYKYYIKEQQGSLAMRRLVSNTEFVLVSQLTQVELVNVLMKEIRRQRTSKRQAGIIIQRLSHDIGTEGKNRPFTL
jgi:predicted nucleic acid-binding protein